MATVKKTAPKKKTASDYGYASAVVHAIPELESKMKQAIKQNWTRDKFEAEIRNTKWWKNTTDAKRRWAVLEKEKPTQAKEQVNRRQNDLRAQAQSMGVSVTEGWLNQTARRIESGAWDEGMTRRYLAAQFTLGKLDDDTPTTGQAAVSVSQLRDMSNEWGLPLTDKAASDWTKQMLAGTKTIADFEEKMRYDARGKYVGIADDLERGYSVEQVYSPYREAASRILGLNPTEINLTDTKWSKPLTNRGSDGKAKAMSLDEWEKTLRKDVSYGWENTTDAVNQAQLMAAQMRRVFGMGS